MDLQAYSWACGSSIRAISGPKKTLNTKDPTHEESVQPTHAQGLLSLWAAAVHVAAAQGDVEDIESELGPAISLRAETKSVPMFASIDEIEDGCQEIDSPHSRDTEKENLSENKMGTGVLDQKNDDEKTILHDGNRTSIVPLAEIRRDSATGNDADAGFLALLSAWSDDAPASKLLENARLEPAKISTKQNKKAEHSRVEKAGKTPSKVVLEKLRSKFPHTRASSPPPESKRWRTQDFDIYFGTDGAIKPRAEPWPTLEEDVAKEMQSTSRSSPLLAELRMQLAADRVTRAPSDYSSFSKHLSDKGDPRQLPVAEVIAVQRARRAPEDLTAPVCVEKQRGWKMRSWGMAFWSYECGEAACECFRQYPPSTGSSDPGQIPVRARVDELGKYINILHDMDPQCAEDRYLAYPRYIASWSPFGSIPKAKRLFEQDLNSRRRHWAPPGLKDKTPKWFDLCCLAVGLQIVQELAAQDTLQFGPAGAVTRLHVENNMAHVWHSQIQGRRMFVMFSPQETEKLAGQSCKGAFGRENREWTSSVDIFSTGQKRGRLSETSAHVVVLEPGETVLVPAGWWQCSVALEPFTTISRRFWNRSNRLGICDEIARLSDLREPGPSQRMRLESQLPGLREQIQEDDLSSGED